MRVFFSTYMCMHVSVCIREHVDVYIRVYLWSCCTEEKEAELLGGDYSCPPLPQNNLEDCGPSTFVCLSYVSTCTSCLQSWPVSLLNPWDVSVFMRFLSRSTFGMEKDVWVSIASVVV